MITYVNGYVCTTPCEAAAAKKGKDPFAPPGTPAGKDGKNDKSKGVDGQPATTFGGALANLNQTSAVTPASAPSPSTAAGTQPQSSQPVLNLLV